MWHCRKCDEEIEDPFDACWACGTSREGVEDPAFMPIVDQPEREAGLWSRPTIRGFMAGAKVSILVAFLHPIILVLPAYLLVPAPAWGGGWALFRFVFVVGFVWSMFAAVGGGIAGALGARARIESSALIAGLLSCVLFHLLFLGAFTNAFGHWPAEIILTSLSIAAITGAFAARAGLSATRTSSDENENKYRGLNDGSL